MEFSEALPFLEQEHNAVVVTNRASGAAQSTIVKAGPFEGAMAFVVRGNTVKLRHLRRDPHCTVLVVQPDLRRYVSVEGVVELRGSDDTPPEDLRMLLRNAFVAAGGSHDNWSEFDRVMRDERRVVVLVRPERVYGRV